MPEELASRDCPVCGGKVRELLYRQRFAGFDAGGLLDGYDVVVCRECGMVYADGIPAQAAFDRYYAAMSKYEHADREGLETPHDLARFAAMAEACMPHLTAGRARVLDVGCATGGLLAAFRDRGVSEVHGLDPSPACAAAAGRLYGIPVTVGALGALPAMPAPFDLVMLVGVVEHVRDIRSALLAVRGLLAAEGLVFVEVPDTQGFADWPGPPFQEFSVEHVNFLTARSTVSLMAGCGFSSVFCERTAREWAPGSTAPVVYGLFRRTDTELPPVPDESGRAGIERYVGECGREEAAVAARLAAQRGDGERICVWGAGTHTQRLIAAGILDPADVVLIADANAHYHGRSLCGVPVVAPGELAAHGEPILVSTRAYQREIVARIRGELGLSNRLITLYDV